MTKVTDLDEADAVADNDYFYMWDASDPANPDKKIPASKVRPSGSKLTNAFRYAGNIVLPAINAGTESSVTISVPGAAAGDHATFNMQDALPADLAITSVRVSVADTVSIRFRNLHASNNYAGGTLLCTALVIRSA
jgi:hypothetical protein